MTLPATIDRYEVIDRLGHGGMGIVYKARDPRLGRTVAVKVLATDDEHYRRRLFQEARLAATLQHKNIVTVFDYGEQETGPFIVMEYVEGTTIADSLAQGVPLPFERKLELLHDLAAAIDYAHRRGIVHRDIKPANLMIDRGGDLKVLDFGIARAAESQLTQTGALLGTLKYMAPEQIEGQPADRRSDVFAVGVTAYELLSTRKAFDGDGVVKAILLQDPLPLRQVCPDADQDVERIVTTAIEKDPSRRYQTLALMAADFERALQRRRSSPGTRPSRDDEETRSDVTVVRAPRMSPAASEVEPRATPPASRPRLALTIGGVVAALVVVLGAGLAVMRWGATPSTTVDTATRSAVTPAPRPLAPSPDSPVSAPPDAGLVPAPLPIKTPPPIAKPAVEPRKPSVPVAVSIPEALQSACDQGDAAKCFQLGQAYRAGNAVRADSVRAAALFQQACDARHSEACHELGNAYRSGVGVPLELARAATLYQRACDANYGPSCASLGVFYGRGLSVGRDEARAVLLFQRACEAGDGGGCENAGRVYELGLGVPKDNARAVSFYQRGCTAADVAACQSLGWAYFRGAGIEQDEARAVTLFRNACDQGNAPGCNNLGAAMEQGRGTAKDEKRAADLYQQACDKNHPLGCLNLGWMYQRGTVLPMDSARASALFLRACEAGAAAGCMNAGYAYAVGRGIGPDPVRAVGFYQRACDAGIAEGCSRAGTMYEQGRGVAKDTVRAEGLYARGRALTGNAGPVAAPPPPDTKPGPASAGATSTAGPVSPPARLKEVRPEYPAAALYAKVQGNVVLEVTIGTDGAVTKTRVAQSIPLLDAAAEDAVKQWRFAVTVVNGKPVVVTMPLAVRFSLSNATPTASTP